jgi:hypothetical protein
LKFLAPSLTLFKILQFHEKYQAKFLIFLQTEIRNAKGIYSDVSFSNLTHNSQRFEGLLVLRTCIASFWE